MNSIEKLAEMFEKFPGVGKRQAKRFVYYLLRKNINFNRDLSNAISHLKDNIKLCQESFQYFYTTDKNENLSPIARDPNRDRSTLLVVEKDSDLENLESMRFYHGLYFVLGGSIPVLAKNPEEIIRIKELKNIIEKKVSSGELKEIILGLSVNPQGEYTLEYLKEKLSDVENRGIKISILGRGLSTGTELEYSDKETFESAFANRK
jgi:recombination protein RecR